MDRKILNDRIRGSFVGGAVGDALGFPVEFLDDELIFQRFGENGITRYELFQNTALISDDTQMSMFTADGMICAEEKCVSPSVEQYVTSVYESYLNWLSTQDADYVLPEGVRESELSDLRELRSCRAPGHTCLEALRSGICGTPERGINRSKGCGGVMRVAPVALFLSSKEGVSRATLGETAARVAAITHSHPLGYIPAAFLALLIDEFLKTGYRKDSVSRALSDTRLLFEESDDMNYFCSLIEKAEEFAGDEGAVDDLEAIRELGAGWVAEETVAIAVYCTLRHKDSFEQAIIASVNHSGDSDSTGAVTGNLIGALLGYEKIPRKYLDNLELHDVLLTMAKHLSHEPRICEYHDRFAESVKDLLVELHAHHVDLDMDGVFVLNDYFRDGYFGFLSEEMSEGGGKFFIAERSGVVVGMVACKIMQGGGEAEYTTTCPQIGFISDLVVTKSERGCGVGKALLKRAEEFFADEGCQYVSLDVFAPNREAAEFYAKAGYEVSSVHFSKKTDIYR